MFLLSTILHIVMHTVDLSFRNGHIDICEFLFEDLNCDLNCVNRKGESPLECALE